MARILSQQEVHDLLKAPDDHILTDEQCDEFRRLPVSFNDMVRAIYNAGRNREKG